MTHPGLPLPHDCYQCRQLPDGQMCRAHIDAASRTEALLDAGDALAQAHRPPPRPSGSEAVDRPTETLITDETEAPRGPVSSDDYRGGSSGCPRCRYHYKTMDDGRIIQFRVCGDCGPEIVGEAEALAAPAEMEAPDAAERFQPFITQQEKLREWGEGCDHYDDTGGFCGSTPVATVQHEHGHGTLLACWAHAQAYENPVPIQAPDAAEHSRPGKGMGPDIDAMSTLAGICAVRDCGRALDPEGCVTFCPQCCLERCDAEATSDTAEMEAPDAEALSARPGDTRRCAHVGERSKLQCIRPAHSSGRHDYRR